MIYEAETKSSPANNVQRCKARRPSLHVVALGSLNSPLYRDILVPCPSQIVESVRPAAAIDEPGKILRLATFLSNVQEETPC